MAVGLLAGGLLAGGLLAGGLLVGGLLVDGLLAGGLFAGGLLFDGLLGELLGGLFGGFTTGWEFPTPLTEGKVGGEAVAGGTTTGIFFLDQVSIFALKKRNCRYHT